MSPIPVPDLGAYLREQREAAQLSLRQLADRAGMSNPYLSQVERGLRKPSAEILNALADALGLSAEALYVRAGILAPAPEAGSVPAAIRADLALDERQRRALLDLYALFVRDAAADPPDGPPAGPSITPGGGDLPPVPAPLPDGPDAAAPAPDRHDHHVRDSHHDDPGSRVVVPIHLARDRKENP